MIGLGMVRPVLKWPGSKWRMAASIATYLPAGRTYMEPCCGSAAVLFARRPVEVEIISDADYDVINTLRMIRDNPVALAAKISSTPWSREEYESCGVPAGDPIEDARRFLVRTWMGYGSRAMVTPYFSACGSSEDVWPSIPDRILRASPRLAEVDIVCADALSMIRHHQAGDVVLYVDPPYHPDTMTDGRYYRHMMPARRHTDLLKLLANHPGAAILSGYAHPEYDRLLSGWSHIQSAVHSNGYGERTEALWLNPQAAAFCLYKK